MAPANAQVMQLACDIGSSRSSGGGVGGGKELTLHW
jgi:hypothetical protein